MSPQDWADFQTFCDRQRGRVRQKWLATEARIARRQRDLVGEWDDRTPLVQGRVKVTPSLEIYDERGW